MADGTDALRSWLERNKIFIEAVVATLLSVTAIIVAMKANSIAEMQTSVEKLEHMPRLEGRVRNDRTTPLPFARKDVFVIFNRGEELTEFDCSTFANLAVYSRARKGVISRVAIDGYFNLAGAGATGEGKGAIFEMNVDTTAEKLLRKNGYLEIEPYGKMEYVDAFNEKHTEYFTLDEIAEKINEKEWKKAKAEYDASLKKHGKHSLADLAVMLDGELRNLQY